jgi:7-cyano-7-deazaguanine reductase
VAEQPRIPISGPLPTPSDPDQAREALKEAAFAAPDVQLVIMEATEFTALCPRTGQPDFGSVIIEYTPKALCIESKALKYYLWSFRNEGAFCESIAGRIADDIVYAIDPAGVMVEVTQNIRGGIGIVARAIRGELEA